MCQWAKFELTLRAPRRFPPPPGIHKNTHSRGLRPLPPTPKKRCRREVSENASKTVLQSVARSVAHAHSVLFSETKIARAALDKRPLRRGFEYTAKHLLQRFRTSCCRKLFKKVVEIVVELTQNWCRDVFGVVPWGPKRFPRNEQAATRDPRGQSSDYSKELLGNLWGQGLSHLSYLYAWDPQPPTPLYCFLSSRSLLFHTVLFRTPPRTPDPSGVGGFKASAFFDPQRNSKRKIKTFPLPPKQREL